MVSNEIRNPCNHVYLKVTMILLKLSSSDEMIEHVYCKQFRSAWPEVIHVLYALLTTWARLSEQCLSEPRLHCSRPDHRPCTEPAHCTQKVIILSKIKKKITNTLLENVVCHEGPCYIRWRHGMGSLFELLALFNDNPEVSGGFPSQRANDAWYYIFFDVILNKLFNKHSCLVELPVIWDTLTLMWQHCNKWGSVTQKWQACRPGLITNRTSLRLFV